MYRYTRSISPWLMDSTAGVPGVMDFQLESVELWIHLQQESVGSVS